MEESWKEQRCGVLSKLVWYNLKDLEQRVSEEMWRATEKGHEWNQLTVHLGRGRLWMERVSKCKREGEGEGDQAHGRGPASEIELWTPSVVLFLSIPPSFSIPLPLSLSQTLSVSALLLWCRSSETPLFPLLEEQGEDTAVPPKRGMEEGSWHEIGKTGCRGEKNITLQTNSLKCYKYDIV